MIPENRLSTEPVPGRLIHDLGVETSPVLDYKPGGIAIQDPTKGLDYQIWRGRVFSPNTDQSRIVIDGRFSPEYEILQYPYICEFNFSFDFNMRPLAVFLANEILEVGGKEVPVQNCYMYWFDNTLGDFDLIFLGSVIRTPKLLIDDPRMEESNFYSLSDVCLFYWNNGNLYVRYLRDRFTEEHLLKRNVPYIQRVGMNEYYRLQFEFFRQADVCER
ncbi:hypothetical protein ZC03_006 [Pseudomonas phage ZC03]|uniref:Uncharacterized protein n=1 Tax=Pseudomonas phage ZC03 TaxID=1622115 RepID=A0A1L2C907_9CAUD|nr:tail fiber protein [Pseudomonas phage ZC03]AMD43393.1 hypothetical protein ZC03_006 [Pseudomonas phage ZC03]